ncbi:hypothetical protein [Streptomyces sp. NPDC087212]|uniref:hypothetical protein n=1 Tax=Streptomyces sp. NPDC087212 TaxID=3365766 RepID=UPI0037F7537C
MTAVPARTLNNAVQIPQLGFGAFDLFDFELGPGDMGEISALNRDERIGFDPDTFNG